MPNSVLHLRSAYCLENELTVCTVGVEKKIGRLVMKT